MTSPVIYVAVLLTVGSLAAAHYGTYSRGDWWFTLTCVAVGWAMLIYARWVPQP